MRRLCRRELVVPVPPLVGRGLGVALRRVLPLLLPPQGGDVEVAPGAAHRLVAAVVDEVGPEHPVAVADERVRAVPLVHAEVGVEPVGHGEPRHRPPHPLLQPRDLGLRAPRDEDQGGVAGVQVREVGDLIGEHGAARTRVVRPAVHPGLEEGAVDDQLAAALEQYVALPFACFVQRLRIARSATSAPRSVTVRRNRPGIVSGAATGVTLSTTGGGELRIGSGKLRRDGEEWQQFVPRRSLGRRHGRASLRRLSWGRTRARTPGPPRLNARDIAADRGACSAHAQWSRVCWSACSSSPQVPR